MEEGTEVAPDGQRRELGGDFLSVFYRFEPFLMRGFLDNGWLQPGFGRVSRDNAMSRVFDALALVRVF